MSGQRAEVWKDGGLVWTVALINTPNYHPDLRIIDRPDDSESDKDFDTHAEALAWAIQETHRPQSGETDSGEAKG